MGDRALVVFKRIDTNINVAERRAQYSPIIYLHWGGEKVPELLSKLRKLMTSRGEDLNYQAARFVGICHDENPGNLSLGMWNLPDNFTESADQSHGDAGLIVVDIKDYSFKQYGHHYDLKQLSDEGVKTVETVFTKDGVEISLGDPDSVRSIRNLTHEEAQELALQLTEGLLEQNGKVVTGR